MSKNMNAFRQAVAFAAVQGHSLLSGGAWIARCERCDQSAYADDGVWAEPCRPRCKGPNCTRAAVRNGLCHAHSKQAARGSTLHPLRPTRPALESVSLRVPASVRAAVLADAEGAREALEAWASEDVD